MEKHSELVAMRADFLSYLPNDILTKVDRASMLHSLEVRAPFLDRVLVETAFARVPLEFKVSEGRSKILMKYLARRVLPGDLHIERKQGFSLPRELFRSQQWQAFASESIGNLPRGWFDESALARMQRRLLDEPNYAPATFVFVLLARWQARWGVS
jgi:asparagine synthase (glutamine-hydrolysing)